MEDIKTIITAIAVFIAAVSAGAAIYQGYITRDTARRQLRAYVSAIPKFMIAFDQNNLAGFNFRMENVGATPAKNVRHSAEIRVFPYPLPDDFIFPDLSEVYTSGVVLQPSVKIDGTRTAGQPFTVKEIAGIRSGTSRIYVYGDVTYEHIFDKANTRFGYSITASKDHLKKLTDNYEETDLTIKFEALGDYNDAT